METLPNLTKINDTYPIIDVITEDIVYIDEPIITLGKNNLGVDVISLFVDEDTVTKRYLNVLVSKDNLGKYLSGELTLYNIIQNSTAAYIVDKSGDDRDISKIGISDIPEDYFPALSSLYPYRQLRLQSNTFEYVFKGGFADAFNALEARDSSKLENAVSSIFESIANRIFDKENLKILSKATHIGSHKVEYEIKAIGEDGQMDMTVDEAKISALYKDIIDYTWNSLSKEVAGITTEMLKGEKVDVLKKKFKDYLESYNTSAEELSKIDYKMKIMLLDVSEQNKNIASILRNGYSSISINDTSNAETRIISIVDSKKSLEVDRAFAELSKNLSVTRESPKLYEAHVYQLNTETGNGWVKIKSTEDGKEKVEKTRIRVLNLDNLPDSECMKSFANNEFRNIKAMAEKSMRNITRLIIE